MSGRFAHIYVERGVEHLPLALKILARFPKATVIPIRHYKDIFSRPGQSFAAQKRCQNLILAEGRPPFLYKGADVCPSFGNPAFYYASSIMNCIYDCDYCYLQGMYPSANLVVFVNVEEIFREAVRVADSAGALHQVSGLPALYLCNSYDTDLLALRGIAPLADMWLDFAESRPDILVEMRTKSVAVSLFSERKSCSNVILAWTLSPEPVARAFEHRAPPISARLAAASMAAEAGWRVRLCIDPMLFVTDWQEHYAGLVKEISEGIDTSLIESVSYGIFRMGKEFLKRARKVNPLSPVLFYPFDLESGVYTYPMSLRREMLDFMGRRLSELFPAERLYAQERL